MENPKKSTPPQFYQEITFLFIGIYPLNMIKYLFYLSPKLCSFSDIDPTIKVVYLTRCHFRSVPRLFRIMVLDIQKQTKATLCGFYCWGNLLFSSPTECSPKHSFVYFRRLTYLIQNSLCFFKFDFQNLFIHLKLCSYKQFHTFLWKEKHCRFYSFHTK